MAKKLFKDIVSTGGVYFVVSIIGAISGILFPRLLGRDQWGLWSITIGLVGLLAPIAQVAMSTTLTTFISKFKDDKEKVSSYINSAYVIAITSSTLVGVTLIILRGYLSKSVFQDERLSLFILLAAGIIFFKQINVINRDYFRGFRDFKRYNLLKLMPTLFIFFLTLAFLLIFSYRAIYIVISHFSVAGLFCIAVLIYLFKKEEPFKLFRIPSKGITKKVLKFGTPLIFTMTFMNIMKSMDRVLLGFFLETPDVGVYSVAAGIPLMIGSMFTPIGTVLLPTFSKRESKGESSESLLREVFSFLLFVSIPMVIFIILFSKDILHLIFGEEYVVGATVLSITSIEIFLYSGERLLGASIVATEKTLAYALGIGSSTGTNVILNIVLIPLFGIEGAAIGTVISFFVLFSIMVAISKRDYRFDILQIEIKSIFILLTATLISGITLKRYLEGYVSFVVTLFVFILLMLVFAELSALKWYEQLKTHIKEWFFL
ncbi:MAG: flippase [Candidatus Natronoplasma sp.]